MHLRQCPAWLHGVSLPNAVAVHQELAVEAMSQAACPPCRDTQAALRHDCGRASSKAQGC